MKSDDVQYRACVFAISVYAKSKTLLSDIFDFSLWAHTLNYIFFMYCAMIYSRACRYELVKLMTYVKKLLEMSEIEHHKQSIFFYLFLEFLINRRVS